MKRTFQAQNFNPSLDGSTWKDPEQFIVPRNPRFSPALLFSRRSRDIPLRWAKGPVGTHKWGRYAIYHAAKALGLGGDVEVLVPEFHCHVIVEAILAAGTSVTYYRVDDRGKEGSESASSNTLFSTSDMLDSLP